MPNHVTNELKAAPRILDMLRNGEDAIDFERIVPMPEILRGETHAGVIDWAMVAMGVINLNTLSRPVGDPVAAFKSGNYGVAADALHQSNVLRMLQQGPYPKDFSNDDFEKLLRCMRAIKETGYPTWFEWSKDHWGTKWNAYDSSRKSDDTVRFDTAWSPPLKWLAALIEKFPGEPLTLRWADEDFGNNAGSISIDSLGEMTGGKLENGSVEAHTLALELKHDGVIPEDMVKGADGRLSYTDNE